MALRPITIPFAVQSNPQEFREQGGERMINAYAVREGEGRDARYIVRMAPGQTALSSDAADIGSRGAILLGSYIYAVFETGVYKFEVILTAGALSLGARTRIGSIAGIGKVYMALNANDQIGVVNALGRYYVIADDAITQVNTSDIGAFNCICWVDGYFFLTLEDGRFVNTGLNDAFTINGLDVATAEGSPDGLLGCLALGSELVLPGKNTVEFWGNSGNPTGSPFSRQGGSWLNVGAMSMASFALFNNTIGWVGSDGIVYELRGGGQKRISNEAVERAIANAASPSTIEGWSYAIHGHYYYVISDANFTWVYDAKEGLWHERKSQGANRWKANTFLALGAKTVVGTIDDGNIYLLDMDSRLEGGEEIIWDIVSVNSGETPARAIVAEIEINFVTGRASLTGTAPQTDPQATLSYSDDGGATWSTPRQLTLGRHGEYNRRARLHRFGRTGSKFGRRWRVTGSDPHIMAITYLKAWVEAVA